MAIEVEVNLVCRGCSIFHNIASGEVAEWSRASRQSRPCSLACERARPCACSKAATWPFSNTMARCSAVCPACSPRPIAGSVARSIRRRLDAACLVPGRGVGPTIQQGLGGLGARVVSGGQVQWRGAVLANQRNERGGEGPVGQRRARGLDGDRPPGFWRGGRWQHAPSAAGSFCHQDYGARRSGGRSSQPCFAYSGRSRVAAVLGPLRRALPVLPRGVAWLRSCPTEKRRLPGLATAPQSYRGLPERPRGAPWRRPAQAAGTAAHGRRPAASPPLSGGYVVRRFDLRALI